MNGANLDQTVVIGTDIATIFMYHWDDLPHRRVCPFTWHTVHTACETEFRAGRLVAFFVGGDGGYRVRLTDAPLRGEETNHRLRSWDFRLRIRHGRVYLDGGDRLPSKDNHPPPDKPGSADGAWVQLPNGNYRVSVHAIAWPDGERADDDANYVVQFQRVAQLEEIPVRGGFLPNLDLLEKWSDAEVDASLAEGEQICWDQATDQPDSGEEVLPLIERDEPLLFPGHRRKIQVEGDLRGTPWRRALDLLQAPPHSRPGRFAELQRGWVLAPPSVRPDDVVCGVSIHGVESTGEERSFTMAGGGFYRWLRRESKGGFLGWGARPMARVRKLWRPGSVVEPARLDALVDAFARFAETDPAFRAQEPAPSFAVETLRDLRSVSGLTERLIELVPAGRPERMALVGLSNAERARRLIEILTNFA